jgi:hypothetical protein
VTRCTFPHFSRLKHTDVACMRQRKWCYTLILFIAAILAANLPPAINRIAQHGRALMVSKKAIADMENVIEEMTLQELVALKKSVDDWITTKQSEARDKFIAETRESAPLPWASTSPPCLAARRLGSGAVAPGSARAPQSSTATLPTPARRGRGAGASRAGSPARRPTARRRTTS